MSFSKLIAKHLKEVYYGGNWTYSTLKQHIEDVTWEEAIQKVGNLNTIAILLNHMNYYITAATDVLKKQPLNAKDTYSFSHPPITSESDWKAFVARKFREVDEFTALIEKIPDEKLTELFAEEKWGNYYRNLHGIIEHCHYHLGQIVLLKKMIRNQ